MKLAVPDMISNSYFPAVAAVELGFFKQQGLDPRLQFSLHCSRFHSSMISVRVSETTLCPRGLRLR